tara:strand:- start:594 stop:983 length:390 start_codon:yes stop_codon:yes gene_type:complete
MSTLAVGTIKSISSAAPVFQNTSGTEIGQICKSWVQFDGRSTPSIADSFNVSSITDNGTGDYDVNFSTNMSNANYSVVTGANYLDSDSAGRVFAVVRTMATTDYQVKIFGDGGGSLDSQRVFGAVFGDN